MHGFTPATRHLSAVRARPAFFCTHGALPWPDRQFLTLRESKSMYNSYIQTCAYSPATRHLSAVRARPAFFPTHGALPWPDRNSLLCGSVKACIKVTSKHARIRLLRWLQIATPSVPYFRSFTLSNKPRSNGQLHFYIYRF
jgi:hypothetical protein